MGVLGILTCEILELEFAYLLGTDPDVAQVTVLEDTRSTRLIEALELRGARNVRRIPHVKSFSPEPSDQPEVLVRVLEVALHRRKEILRRGLVGAAREMSCHVDALLLGYGLCGNALENPKTLLDVGVPVFVPMDGDKPVDDCVGLILGGREHYYAEQRRVPGTFYMTPGWSCHWKGMFGGDPDEVKQETAKRLFANYDRTLLVLTPVMPEDEMKHSANKFCRLFGLTVQERRGTLGILEQAWQSAKTYLRAKPDGPGMTTAGHGS
jgi:hypothetical protein